MKRLIHQPGLAGLWLLLALAACNAGEPHAPALNDVNTQLAFTCAYEKDRRLPLKSLDEHIFRYTHRRIAAEVSRPAI